MKLAEQGKKVAVISSGDSGVYGMAGLVYEVLIEKGMEKGKQASRLKLYRGFLLLILALLY
ncbi:hypothetical protein GCM10020331_062530 [Ectobacillus funiculus]